MDEFTIVVGSNKPLHPDECKCSRVMKIKLPRRPELSAFYTGETIDTIPDQCVVCGRPLLTLRVKNYEITNRFDLLDFDMASIQHDMRRDAAYKNLGIDTGGHDG